LFSDPQAPFWCLRVIFGTEFAEGKLKDYKIKKLKEY